MRLRSSLWFTIAASLLVLGACGGTQDPVRQTAREFMEGDGMAEAAITQIVEGDPNVRGADELYCVATDASTQGGELPYLLVVWRTGDGWHAAPLQEGYYEWDLQGCPR